MVQGRQFPAGQYRVEENDLDHSIVLIRSKYGKATGMFVLTTPIANADPAGDMPALSFTRDENQYRLDDIWDAAGQGHAVRAVRSQKDSASKKAAASAPTHSTQGVVKSVDGTMLVITRNDAAHTEMTFMMNPSTHRQGTLAVGSSVSVRYREEGSSNVAMAVTAKPAKQQASHAAPKKK
jgi:hypothetical protein